MKKYKVFCERVEIKYAVIEANSKNEAEELADENFSDYAWVEIHGTANNRILIGESEIEEIQQILTQLKDT